MKATHINLLDKEDALKLLAELIEVICVTYDLRTPDVKFIAHLLNVLRKHFGYFTFEMLHDAFERNSMGLLNQYLPNSNNQYVDNKVKFTIPDFTKIIKAYAELKGMAKPVQAENTSITPERRIKIKTAWVAALNEMFIAYRDRNQRENITLPIYTAKVLAGAGYVETSAIDLNDRKININFGRKVPRRSSINENLVFEAFDRMIAEGVEPVQVLLNHEMPY